MIIVFLGGSFLCGLSVEQLASLILKHAILCIESNVLLYVHSCRSIYKKNNWSVEVLASTTDMSVVLIKIDAGENSSHLHELRP